jgi:hypothetical protein
MSRKDALPDPRFVFLPGGTSLAEINEWIAELHNRAPEPPSEIDAAIKEVAKARMVRPRYLPVPGQSFLPVPDHRAKEAINGLPARDGRFTIRQAMHQRVGVCG